MERFGQADCEHHLDEESAGLDASNMLQPGDRRDIVPADYKGHKDTYNALRFEIWRAGYVSMWESHCKMHFYLGLVRQDVDALGDLVAKKREPKPTNKEFG